MFRIVLKRTNWKKLKKTLMLGIMFLLILPAFSMLLPKAQAEEYTFGKTDIGSSSASNWRWSSKYACRFEAPSSGTITQIDFYGRTSIGGQTCYLAVYSDSAGAPDALLGSGSVVITTTADWYTVSGLSISIAEKSYYWLTVSWGATSIWYYYDVGVTDQFAEQAEGADAPPPDSSFGSVSTLRAREMSIYASGDLESPQYSNVGQNTTVAGQPCQFSTKWTDNVNMSGYIFGTNNTGVWTNETWTASSPPSTLVWSNVTKTLNSTPYLTIQWRIWANDTSNNWNNTGIQSFMTTETTAPSPSGMGTNSTVAGTPCSFSTYWTNQRLSGFIFSTNNTGTWTNDTWSDPWSGEPANGWSNITKTLNSTPYLTIQWRIYCNDSSGNWGDTGIQQFTTTETNAPVPSNSNTNTTVAGTLCLFYTKWTNLKLSGYIFGTNNTGTWRNDTWIDEWPGEPTVGWSNLTKTLNNTAYTKIQWRIWCNDSSGNWGDTGVLELTLSELDAPKYSNVGQNTTIAGQPCLFHTYWTDQKLEAYIFGTNNTGTWVNETESSFSSHTFSWSNVTKTLNSTVGVRVEWCVWARDNSSNWNNTGIQFLVTNMYARIIYVDDDNTEGPWDGTPEHPYQNITSAHEHASTNATIYVFNGTYSENVVLNKTLSLLGENRNTTIIDGMDGTAVHVGFVYDVVIKEFTIRNSSCGVHLSVSSNTTVSGNIITNNSRGIYCTGLNADVRISGNNIKNNEIGVYLYASSNNTISSNAFEENYRTIYLNFSSFNAISENNMTLPTPTYDLLSPRGITLLHSTNNNISKNSIIGSTYPYVSGVWLSHSANNTISENNIMNNYYGLFASSSSNNTINENNMTSNTLVGLCLSSSPQNSLAGNQMTNNNRNFWVSGGNISDFVNEVDSSNTVDGKPIYYWIDRRDLTVPVDAGFVALVNCINMTAKNLDLAKNGQGFLLVNTTYSTITDNTVTNNEVGIEVFLSSDNTFSGNNILGSLIGIQLQNTSSNQFYHNNLFNSGLQHGVVYYPDVHTSLWDNDFEGNFWDDYNGNDADHDGIGDTPYVIDVNNQDNYPLVGTFHDFELAICISNSSVFAFEYESESIAIRFNVTGPDGTDGFCRICIPHSILEPPHIVSIDGGLTEVQHFNASLHDNSTDRWIYFAYSHSTHEIVIRGEMKGTVSISVTPSSALVGYEVNVVGSLVFQHNSSGIPNVPVQLYYSIPGTEDWPIFAATTTNLDGSFSVTWFLLASGDYRIKAVYTGGSGVAGAETIVNLAIRDIEERVFSVSSNSTVSGLIFNSTSREITLSVSGPSGTTGYINTFLTKNLIQDISSLRIYFDGVQKDYEAVSLDDVWLIHLSYNHSTHTIRISLPTALPTYVFRPLATQIVAIIATALVVASTFALLFRKKKFREDACIHKASSLSNVRC